MILTSPDLKGDLSHLHFRTQLGLQTELADLRIHSIVHTRHRASRALMQPPLVKSF